MSVTRPGSPRARWHSPRVGVIVVAALAALAATASAQSSPTVADGGPDVQPTTPPAAPAPAAIADPSPPPIVVPPRSPRVQIHGFVSEGAFAITANDYFGTSTRAGLEFFEGGINFSTEVVDRLRVGMQLFSRDIGSIRDTSPRLDWAYLDYRWKRWLGVRAGIIKMPFGLYNEYVDIDAARLSILLPSSVYPIRNRDVLLSNTGFSLYGDRRLGSGGELDFQVWGGTLTVPRTAIQLVGASLDSVAVKYDAGGQVFWHPPIEGLRIGATLLRTSVDFHITLDANVVAAVIMAGLAPAGYNGKLLVTQRPISLVVGSAEYLHGDWLFAAEYSRARTHQRSSLAAISPVLDHDSESAYAMATYHALPWLEAGAYYSIFNFDVDGTPPKYSVRSAAFQRDLAATLRFDVNDHWLWKLEAHYMDGVASLPAEFNTRPDRFWGLFLLRTTVTF